MNRFNRTLLGIMSLVGLLLMVIVAAMVYPIPYLSEWIAISWINGLWFSYMVVVACSLLGIFFLILFLTALFSSSSDQFLTIKTAMGVIEISKKTIESTAKRSFQEIVEVKNPIVTAKLKRKAEDTQIFVTAEVFDAKSLPTLAEDIQQRVKNSVESALEVSVSSIKVQIKEANGQSSKTKTTQGSARVI